MKCRNYQNGGFNKETPCSGPLVWKADGLATSDPYLCDEHKRQYQKDNTSLKWSTIEPRPNESFKGSIPTQQLSSIPAVQSINSQEEKVFQVTNYNHATGALSNGAFKTQEEAQLNLETQVANLRANLTVKQFFTLSLLDTKTGKFLGFVSDLPPAVTLTGASS